MNHQANHPEPNHALNLPGAVKPSALDVFARVVAVVVAALLVVVAVAVVAASVPAVAAVLAMAAAVAVVGAAVALPVVLVQAVGEAL